MNKKTIIAMGVLAAILIAGGVWYVKSKEHVAESQENQQTDRGKQDNKKDQGHANTEINTDDWKTYTNKGWSYSIKYPSQLYIKSNPQGDKFPGDAEGDERLPKDWPPHDGGQTLIISDKEKMGIQDIMPDEGIHIQIDTFKLTATRERNQTFETYFKEDKNVSKISINGIEAYEASNTKDQNQNISIYVIKNDWVYSLHGINLLNENKDSSNFRLMRKIFETFEFLNK